MKIYKIGGFANSVIAFANPHRAFVIRSNENYVNVGMSGSYQRDGTVLYNRKIALEIKGNVKLYKNLDGEYIIFYTSTHTGFNLTKKEIVTSKDGGWEESNIKKIYLKNTK
jgi:hypothetical protein